MTDRLHARDANCAATLVARQPGAIMAALGASTGIAHLVLLGATLFFISVGAHAQTGGADSSVVYEKIRAYAQKHKVTRWLYEGIFVEPTTGDASVPSDPLSRRVDPYLKQKGKVIRRIEVHVYDPFGYSIDDTARAPINKLERIGNSLHRTTREHIIRELLLVQALDRVDPLELAESERLLRASPVVNDARLILRPVKTARDSVDLVVSVLDKWSIDLVAERTHGTSSLNLQDRNFLGLGQQLEQGISDTRNIGFGIVGRHSVYNIARTYIGSTVFYSKSNALDQIGADVHRAFYSPLTKWAGGAALTGTWVHRSSVDGTGALVDVPHTEPVALDSWLGRSFPLTDDTSRYGRVARFIVGGRYAQTRFSGEPPSAIDTFQVKVNTSLFLVGAGISLQQFYKERYLFRFGLTEDVPEGFLFRVNAGVRERKGMDHEPYIGAEVTRGRNYDRFGYVSGTLAYGTFLQHGSPNDGALRFDADYFTDLFAIGKWHVRQFVKLRSVIGLGKTADQRLYLNGDQLYGFASTAVSGTRKMVLGFQTVLYVPFSFIGFRFAPVAVIGLGTLDHEHDGWFANRIYPAFALGLLVRNEYLLLKTFQLSIGFYPNVPGAGDATTLFNPTSFELGTRSYAFSEPEVVGYY